MKIKHLLLISLILTILTISAVSASDNNNLTISDNNEDKMFQIDEGEPSDKEDIDCDTKTPTEVRVGNLWEDEDEEDFCVNVEFHDSTEGNLTFLVDDEIVNEVKNIDEEYLYIFNLSGLKIGIHNYTIKYSGDDSFNSFTIFKEFEVYYLKTSIIGMSEGHPIISSDCTYDLNGILDIYIDNKKIKTFDVYNDRYDSNEREISHYLISYLDDYDLTFGLHNYTVAYHDGNYPDVINKGSFNKEYYFKVHGNYENCLVGDIISFKTNLPSDAKGNIRLNANGKSYTIFPNDEGEYNFDFTVNTFGENNFVFTYEDDKYYKKDVNIVFNTSAEILVPDDFIFNSDEVISLILPDNALGNLTVYESVYDDVSDENVPGNVIVTKALNNGKVTINLANYLPLGYSNIFVIYSGNYEVEKVETEVCIIPKITLPDLLYDEDNYNIIVESPNTVENNTRIIIRYWDEKEYTWIDQTVIYNDSSKTYLNVNLPKLNVGKYNIGVFVDEGYNSKSFKVTNISHNPRILVDFPKIIKYDDYSPYYSINGIVEDMEGYITLYIDDIKIKQFNVNSYNSKQYFPINKLEFGSHTWLITYSGDDYFKSCNITGNFEVTWIIIPNEIIDNDIITFELNDRNISGVLSLLIDGKYYDMVFLNSDGEAKIVINGISYGEHSYEVTYSGDDKHSKLTKTGKFKIVPEFYCSNLEPDEVIPLSNFYPFIMKLSEKATGSVTITIGNKTQTVRVINGFCKANFTELTQGKYLFSAKYLADNKYSSRECSFNFTIKGYKIISELDEQGNTDYFSLVLPSNAVGNLSVYKRIYDESEYQDVDIKLKSVKVNNGKAIIKVSDLGLDYGNYQLVVKYDGEDYSNVESHWETLKVLPKVIITKYLYLGENARIFIDLDNATGKIGIRLNGYDYVVEDLMNGKINVTIPSEKLFDENVLEFTYTGGDVNNHVFEDYNGGYYKPRLYNIYVSIKNITIPNKIDSNSTGNIIIDLPDNYQAEVIISINGKEVSKNDVNGGKVIIPINNLTIGENHVGVEITGERGDVYHSSNYVTVLKPEPSFNILSSSYNDISQIIITLSDKATGSLIIKINNKFYHAVLNNSRAVFNIPNLNGNYPMIVKYSGSNEYNNFTKYLVIKIKKHDEIKLKLKHVKVKKSSKKLILTATLKINSKLIKGLKLTFKFNKKVLTAKTNKKGIAKVIIKKKFLKKLKVGKKIQYQVSYGGIVKKLSVKVKK